MTGLIRAIALALAAISAAPASAQAPATRFDADYAGRLAGPVSGQIAFKAVNGTLTGTAEGTVDGRSFRGRLEGRIGDGATPALAATITAMVAAKPVTAPSGGGGASGTFPAEPFNGLQLSYAVSGIPLGAPKDEGGFTNTRTFAVLGPASGAVKVSGSSAAYTATCNSEYGSFWFETRAVLTVGKRSKAFATEAPCKQAAGTPVYKVAQGAAKFELAIEDAKPGEAVSFSISQVFVNPRFGNRGLVVSGAHGEGPAAGEEPITLTLDGKLAGKVTSATRTVKFEGSAKASFAGKALDATFTASGGPCPTKRRPDGSCPEATAEACPSAAGGFAPTGLIAAANDASAVVRYQGAPNTKVLVEATLDLPGLPNTAADVRLALPAPASDAGRWDYLGPRVEAETNGSGQLDVRVGLRVRNGDTAFNDAIKAPGRITVRFGELDGRSAKETVPVPIDVGLGAVVEIAKMANLQAEDDSEPRHAWRGYVKSLFHPGLDIAGYVEAFAKCGHPITVPRVTMHSWWSNSDGGEEPLLDGVGGRSMGLTRLGTDAWASGGAILDFARARNGRTYLAPYASSPPAASIDGDRLPGIVQTRDGHVIKAYFGYLNMESRSNIASVEPRVLDRAIYVLSHESSESAAAAFACALEPRDGLQLMALLWTTWLPVYGQASKAVQDWAAIACKLARGDFRGIAEDFAKDKAKDAVVGKLKQVILPKLTRQLVEGQDVPPIVFTLVGVDPASMSARSSAYRKWLADFSGAVDKSVDVGGGALWTPPASGNPTAAPKVPPSAGSGAQDASDMLRGGAPSRAAPAPAPAPSRSQGSAPPPAQGGPMPGMKW